jgi:hypothetical protein
MEALLTFENAKQPTRACIKPTSYRARCATLQGLTLVRKGDG